MRLNAANSSMNVRSSSLVVGADGVVPPVGRNNNTSSSSMVMAENANAKCATVTDNERSNSEAPSSGLMSKRKKMLKINVKAANSVEDGLAVFN